MLRILLWSAVAALSAAGYNVILKRASQRFIFSFWVALCTFLSMTTLFYINHLNQGITFLSTTTRLGSLVISNTPFYLILIVFMVLQIGFKSYLFGKHTLGKIIPILEIGTPLTAGLYFLMGNTITLMQALGIGIISCGAAISGFENIEFPNIFKPFTRLPYKLYVCGITMACLATGENLIVYIATKETAFTESFMIFFKSIPLLEQFRFCFMSPLEYFEVASIFFVSGFFIYLFFFSSYTLRDLGKCFIQEKKLIFWGAAVNTLSQYTYYYIYAGNKQSIIVALTKFSIPLTLAFAYLTFKDRILLPEKVGVTLIIIGGFMATF